MTPAELHHAVLEETKKTTDSTSMADIDPLYAGLLALAEHNKDNKSNQDSNPLKDITGDAQAQAEQAKQQEIATSHQQAQDHLEDLKQALGSDYLITAADLEIVQDPETQLYSLVAHGGLSLNNLTSTDGLELPQKIGGDLDLGSLTSADGLKLPQEIGGGLYLYDLTSADGLELPQEIGGYLNLSSLTSADGLELPQEIGGDLSLNSLTSADGLKLPHEIGGDLFLSSLSPEQKQKLKEQRPDLASEIM